MKQEEINLFIKEFKKAVFMFITMTPLLLGVIGLVGILQTYITADMMASIFGWGVIGDTFVGAFTGAISSGNPTVSYLIGGELLEDGVSLYAVTAFILSWVTLGIIQLPAEAEVFGFQFTLYRNLLSLISTIIIAIATVITVGIIKS